MDDRLYDESVECEMIDTETIMVIPAYEPGHELVEIVSNLSRRGYLIIVVDDGSGTGYEWVWDVISGQARVLHHEENRGKGVALKTAFRYIVEYCPMAVSIVTLDADGQHRLEDIVRVAEESRTFPDSLILGSRRFDDRSVPVRSRFGNLFTRTVFSKVTHRGDVIDTQTGLRGMGRSLLPEMISIEGDRYEYEMNVLLECSKSRLPIRQVMIKTVYHDKENSCSHFQTMPDSIRIYKVILKFASCSLISFLLDYLLFLFFQTAFRSLSYGLILSNAGARIISGSVNYTLNSRVVFSHDEHNNRSLVQYILLSGCILGANTLLLSILVWTGVPPAFAKIAVEVVLFVISFLVQSLVIFRKKNDSRRDGDLSHCDHHGSTTGWMVQVKK